MMRRMTDFSRFGDATEQHAKVVYGFCSDGRHEHLLQLRIA
jgi:hypothetical protein